jgi:hypothetical protein
LPLPEFFFTVTEQGHVFPALPIKYLKCAHSNGKNELLAKSTG